MTVKVPTSKPLPWKKGQSCVSNPVTATHREAARELYKFNFLDSDCLSATTFATERSKISQVSRVSRATTSSRKTERFPNTTGNTSLKEAQLEETLAKSTELTDAEEVKGTLQDVFEIVFRFVNSPLASHRKLCAILQCVRDVIGSQKEQNETAYYALFLNLLEKRSKVVEDEPTLAALSYLLSLVVDRTPTEVLLQTFPRCSQVVTETFQIHQKGSTSLLKSLVHILRGLLVAQNSESWKHVKTKGVFKLLVELALSPRPKLRRKAQDSIYKILSTPFVDFQKEHPIASFLWRNIYKKLLLGFSGEDTKLIHNLTLLQSVVEFLPSQSFDDIFDIIFRIFSSENVYAGQHCLNIMNKLISCCQHDCKLLSRIVQGLLGQPINIGRIELFVPRMTTLALAFLTFLRFFFEEACKHYLDIIKDFFRALQSENATCLSVALQSFHSLLTGTPFVKFQKINETMLKDVVATFERLFSLTYSHAWPECFEIWSYLIESFGPRLLFYLEGGIVLASQLYKDEGFKGKQAHGLMFGKLISCCGASTLFGILPLELNENGELHRSWLLPLCARSNRRCQLGFFRNHILPLIEHVRKARDNFQEARNDSAYLYQRRLYKQLWALLPGFFTLPTDVPSEFNHMAKLLSRCLENDEELHVIICQSLDALVGHFQCVLTSESSSLDEAERAKKSLETVKLYSYNLLAVLFNAYLPSRASFLLKTVTSLVSISDTKVINTFGLQLMSKILSIVTASERNLQVNKRLHALLSLSGTLCIKLDKKHLLRYYNIITKLLKDKDGTVQKLAYTGIGRICQINAEDNNEFLCDHLPELCGLLIDTCDVVHASAKKIRLRLLVVLIPHLPASELSKIHYYLLEAILAVKEVNETTRKLGYQLLITIGKRFLSNNSDESYKRLNGSTAIVSLHEFFRMVLSHLAGQTPHLISATVASLGTLLYEFSNFLHDKEINDLVNTVFKLLRGSSQEILKATLGFVKVALTALSAENFFPHVQPIIETITNWESSVKYHFRMKIKVILERCIRKFGYEFVKKLVPERDQKWLVSIKKNREKAVKKKRLQKINHPTAMAEATLKYNENNANQKRFWIKEDENSTMDFLNPTIVDNIVSVDTNKAKEPITWEHYTKSGKLFITECESGDEKHDSDDEEPSLTKFAMNKEFECKPDFGNNDLKRKKSTKKSQKKVKADNAFEPYAYLPFDPAALNKRTRNKVSNVSRALFRKRKKTLRKNFVHKKKSSTN